MPKNVNVHKSEEFRVQNGGGYVRRQTVQPDHGPSYVEHVLGVSTDACSAVVRLTPAQFAAMIEALQSVVG